MENSKYTITTNEIISTVFADEADFAKACQLVQHVYKRISKDQENRLLSFTYAVTGKRIAFNIGQRYVLVFQKKKSWLECCIPYNYDLFNKAEIFTVLKTDVFSSRWSDNQDFRLIWFKWDHTCVFPENFITAWNSFIDHAAVKFKKSSFKKYHRPELFAAFLDDDHLSNNTD